MRVFQLPQRPPKMCDHYIEVPADRWAGTFCKLLAGHAGPHAPHYQRATSSRKDRPDA